MQKLQFNSSQRHQVEAIQAVIDLFQGQPLAKGRFETGTTEGSVVQTEKGQANNLVLNDEQLLENLQAVQHRFNKNLLTGEDWRKLEVSQSLNTHGKNFTVEMETGTGKTYTYLRTIYELNKQYGFLKFVIVVPSIAIREGVKQALADTKEHFESLYATKAVDPIVYDSKNLSVLSAFSANRSIQILVINIDSFAKDAEEGAKTKKGTANVINQVRESGEAPIELIQSTNPIVIVDEPQNMETEIRKKAIEKLNPLCTLRYSATHKDLYHQIYRLDPVTAYNEGLVKQIEVDSITAEGAYNSAYIEFIAVNNGLQAKIKIYKDDGKKVEPKKLTVSLSDDLFEKSGGRHVYKDFVVDQLEKIGDGYVLGFTNGVKVNEGSTHGGLTEEIIRFQIEKTVQAHFQKQWELTKRGLDIKVISLFFIDKVSNYRVYTETDYENGRYAKWFEESYKKISAYKQYQGVLPHAAEDVHNGYFAADKNQWKDTSGKTSSDNQAYDLIMKDKKGLMSKENPLCFIFSHSALREGWDNPNVFQICTLNETHSELKKRQEIGRGLRLPVMANGERCHDKSVNVLTVLANETYEDFAANLQREFEEDCNVKFEKTMVKNKRERKPITRTKDLETHPLFLEIWEKIRQRTTYSIEYQTTELEKKAIEKLKEVSIQKPKVSSRRVLMDVGAKGIGQKGAEGISTSHITINYDIPNVFGYIASRTSLSRKSIASILEGAGNIASLKNNPQQYLDKAVEAIIDAKYELLVDGIKYKRIDGTYYEMSLFDDAELDGYLDQLWEVNKLDKTIYDWVVKDSEVEERFAHDCEADDSVKFYFKLPRGFKIPTPLGNYNPDWAVLFDGDKHIYFVAETKSDLNNLRRIEELKIKCGKKHFAVIDNVRFEAVTKLDELKAKVEPV